jgi:hypothetical protein
MELSKSTDMLLLKSNVFKKKEAKSSIQIMELFIKDHALNDMASNYKSS